MSREWWQSPKVREIRNNQREEAERVAKAKREPLPKREVLRCSFCYKSEAEVDPVWPSAGRTAAICGECIERSFRRLQEMRKTAARKAEK